MTAVQADCIKGLGAWWGGMFMGSSKVLGEEERGVAAVAQGSHPDGGDDDDDVVGAVRAEDGD